MLISGVKLKGFSKWLMVFYCWLMLLKDRCHRQGSSLEKQLHWDLKPIVVVNKVDKDNCRPDEVQQDVYELMFNLDATDDQLEFATVYGSSKLGWMSGDWKNPTTDIKFLLDTILKEIPEPVYVEGTAQMQVASLDFSSYVGRIAIGRVFRGDITTGSRLYFMQTRWKGKESKG